jgi:hypothetical protein
MAVTKGRRTSTKAAKPAPEVEPDEELDTESTEDDGDLEDMDELEEDEVTETKPATKKSTAQEVTFGINDLRALIKKKTGEDVDARGLRTLIRKMARDDSGRVQREIVAGNRSRYDWSGPNDPEVVAIVKAYQGGELEAEKQAKLKALKENKAAKTAAKKATASVEEDDEDETPAPKRKVAAKKTTAKRKAKPAPVEEVEDDEELDMDEDDE